uniref:Uncharacterized protein n=1 Tax=Rhizophora mucronata TaxID=61149 RepID=A0A2P2QUV0_RHIMU
MIMKAQDQWCGMIVSLPNWHDLNNEITITINIGFIQIDRTPGKDFSHLTIHDQHHDRLT